MLSKGKPAKGINISLKPLPIGEKSKDYGKKKKAGPKCTIKRHPAVYSNKSSEDLINEILNQSINNNESTFPRIPGNKGGNRKPDRT